MNLSILFCAFPIATGFFFLPQAQTSDNNNCLCGLTCPITMERCRPCFGTNCFTPLEASYSVSNFPPYQQPQLPRLSLSYDLVTPPPPMAVPLAREFSLSRGVGLPTITSNWPAPSPVYIQVPASATKTEDNGRSKAEKLLAATEMKDQLHSAGSPPGTKSALPPSSTPPTSTSQLSTAEQDLPTSTFIPEERDNDTVPIPIPSMSNHIDHEPEVQFSFTPSLENSETASSSTTTSTMDPLDYSLIAKTTDDKVLNVTTEVTASNEHGYKTTDYSTSIQDFETTTTSSILENISSVVEPAPRPVLVETTHIELYHPEGEPFTDSTESTTASTTLENMSNEIEITASPGDPQGSGGNNFREDVPSYPLPLPSPTIKSVSSYQMRVPDSPPRIKPKKSKIFKVRFSGYTAKNEEPYAAAPPRNERGDVFQRSAVSYQAWNSKHRDSGISGKQRRRNSIFKKDALLQAYKRTRKMKHEVGATKSEWIARPRPKCNSRRLKKIMQQKMTLSATISKQMIYSATVMRFPGRIINVVCSRYSFSYIVVTSPIYCEHRKAQLTCFTFLQP